MSRSGHKRLKWRWHLPKWAVDFPTPIKRSYNLGEMTDSDLRSLHAFAVTTLMPIARPNIKRWNYVWNMISSINIVTRMSGLERLAHAG